MKAPVIRVPFGEALGRRRKQRARIGLPAVIDTLFGSRRVVLLNISQSGAMIELTGAPKVGSDVIVKCGSIDAMAVVVWVGSGRCGLTFDSLADGAEIMRLQQLGQDAARAKLSPDLIDAADDWQHGRAR